MSLDKEFAREYIQKCELALHCSDMDQVLLRKIVLKATDIENNEPVAISTYPEYIPIIKHNLPANSRVKLGTVVSWPKGGGCDEIKYAEINNAINYYKVHEIEYVVDYRSFYYPLMYNLTYEGLIQEMEKVINDIIKIKDMINKEAVLKVVIEIGEIRDKIKLSCLIRSVILAGIDYIVTSTGKTDHNVTDEHLDILLDQINLSIQTEQPCDKELAAGNDEELLIDLNQYYIENFNKGVLILPNRLRYTESNKVGLILQGGVSDIDQAKHYIQQVENKLGKEYISSTNTFRLSSSVLHPLLTNILLEDEDELRLVHAVAIKNIETPNSDDNQTIKSINTKESINIDEDILENENENENENEKNKVHFMSKDFNDNSATAAIASQDIEGGKLIKMEFLN